MKKNQNCNIKHLDKTIVMTVYRPVPVNILMCFETLASYKGVFMNNLRGGVAIFFREWLNKF